MNTAQRAKHLYKEDFTMKNYERINISLEKLNPSDVIATSAEVTTGDVTMPWSSSQTYNVASYSEISENENSSILYLLN